MPKSKKSNKKSSKKFSEKDYNKFKKDSELPGFEKFLNDEHKDMIKCMANKCGYDIIDVYTKIKKCSILQDADKKKKCMSKLNKKITPTMNCSEKKCKSKQEKYSESVVKLIESDIKQKVKTNRKTSKKTLKKVGRKK